MKLPLPCLLWEDNWIDGSVRAAKLKYPELFSFAKTNNIHISCSGQQCPVRFSYNPSFSAGRVFSSHNKSAGTVFRLVFSAKRMGPICPITCSIYPCQPQLQALRGNLEDLNVNEENMTCGDIHGDQIFFQQQKFIGG